jgi:hypothetical protein
MLSVKVSVLRLADTQLPAAAAAAAFSQAAHQSKPPTLFSESFKYSGK